MGRLSVVIITKNEEANIRDCLEAIKWSDEIIIVDDYSTDRTLQICKEYTDKIFQRQFDGFGAQKGYGLKQASGQWILSLDADEVVSPELREEIRGILEEQTDYDGFRIGVKTIYLGRWIKHCGWSSKLLRLFKKDKSRYDERLVYESVIAQGKIGEFKNCILHNNPFKSLSQHIMKLDLYTTLDAEEIRKKKVRLRPLNYSWYLFLKPILIFFRKYIIMKGFKEGVRGFLISVINAFVVFINYAKLWEKQKNDIHKK